MTAPFPLPHRPVTVGVAPWRRPHPAMYRGNHNAAMPSPVVHHVDYGASTRHRATAPSRGDRENGMRGRKRREARRGEARRDGTRPNETRRVGGGKREQGKNGRGWSWIRRPGTYPQTAGTGGRLNSGRARVVASPKPTPPQLGSRVAEPSRDGPHLPPYARSRARPAT